MSDSPQMRNLKARYGVTTERALVRAIRDDIDAECLDPGEEPTPLTVAEVWLDQALEAEYQRIAGGADEPLDAEPLPLTYEAMQGDPIDTYGTPEHEAWLIEMEGIEG